MKKVLAVILSMFLICSPISAAALNENAGVEIKVLGDIKSGNTIEIFVEVKNVERFYAGAMEFSYDKSLLEVTNIERGDMVNYDGAMFEPNGQNGEIYNDRGLCKYSFTFVGDYEGKNGSGNFLKITGKVLRDGSLIIGKNNMNVKLVERSKDNNMNAMNNYFKGYGSDIIVLTNMAKMYNLTNGEVGFNGLYDLNGDNIIDLFDLVMVSSTMK
ncbi:MAG: cohesin domain-containing protein [Clostridium sp.]